MRSRGVPSWSVEDEKDPPDWEPVRAQACSTKEIGADAGGTEGREIPQRPCDDVALRRQNKGARGHKLMHKGAAGAAGQPAAPQVEGGGG